MTKTEFQELSFDQKGIVFAEGKYIAAREYYNHKINLYSLYDFFVEVWYFPPENRITDIKAVTNDKTLDIYIDSRLKLNGYLPTSGSSDLRVFPI